jgi:hypothetical protein
MTERAYSPVPWRLRVYVLVGNSSSAAACSVSAKSFNRSLGEHPKPAIRDHLKTGQR